MTPLRDGMNLVAKEFIAAQDPENPGVLVLSRFAGAARELDAALLVNPYDPDEIAGALERAIRIGLDERRSRYEAMMGKLRRVTAASWYRDFLAVLGGAGAVPILVEPEYQPPRGRGHRTSASSRRQAHQSAARRTRTAPCGAGGRWF